MPFDNKILVSIMNAFNLAKITQTESVLFCLDKERLQQLMVATGGRNWFYIV